MRTYPVSFRPYWYITPSLRSFDAALTVILAVQLALLALAGDAAALLVIAAAVAASAAADTIAVAALRAERGKTLTACVQGCMCGMLFPQGYPLVSVFALTLCSFLAVKYAFGGAGCSWINAAAFTAAAAYFTGAEFFPEAFSPADYRGTTSPASMFLSSLDASPAAGLTGFLNNSVFRFLGANLPGGLMSRLWDSGSAVPAFRFNLLILAASLVLVPFRFVVWIIPLSFLASYLLLVWVFGGLWFGAGFFSGDVLLAAFTGGTLFTAFFLLNWPGSAPLSVRGKAAYGVCAGVSALFLCGPGLSPAGAAYTALSADVCSLVIQYIETARRAAILERNLLPRIGDYWGEPNDG